MNIQSEKPRILILGAGAVGGYIGAYLARSGRDVILADPWVEHVEVMRRDGLRLQGTSPEECFTTPVRALHLGELQSLRREQLVDIVFISLKSYDTAWASMLLRDVLAPGAVVVVMQNSINEPTVAEVLGWPCVLGGIANKIVVELIQPGFIRRAIAKGGAGFEVFRVGEPHGRITPRAKLIAEMLSEVDSTKITPALWGERWSKLVQNAMSNAVASVSGLSTRSYIEEPSTRRLSIRVAGESAHVGQAIGYPLEPINGEAPELWIEAWREAEGTASGNGAFKRAEEVVLGIASRMEYTARPSMAQDLAKGRRSEIEHINGMVVQEAANHGVEAPINAALLKRVREIELGRATPSLDFAQSI